ncbi:hypothetical Protein YC6258_04617 [Gynuella sunshinyii YC6258]|uniref:Uncharacterized protein n=1 Tax=Gynuella sunshinyii YC6258 TaxID=1445510 RepID=A0A0C5W1U6_9GAMM|nr:hypothetical Protein YC6258_04617 [Gynuella sunshinyii YC6258]
MNCDDIFGMIVSFWRRLLSFTFEEDGMPFVAAKIFPSLCPIFSIFYRQ